MTNQRTAVLFNEPPVIGHQYTLTDWINQDQVTATLLELVDKVDDYGRLPGTGGRVTELNKYAIFECCKSGRRFKRVVFQE